jgi:hypothetical protein
VEFVLDLLQGAGIAAAIGIRPFLPLLLVAALASADLGLDFDGTDFAFLEDWPVVVAVLLVLAIAELGMRRVGNLQARSTFEATLPMLAIALGALAAAGSLADRDHPFVPGLVVGAAAAALGAYAAHTLFTRVRRRLDPEAARVLPLYGEGAAGVAAGLSILFPPLAILVLAALAWLLAGGRRRAGEKYAGLRILR